MQATGPAAYARSVRSSRWQHLRAIALLPGTATVLVPAAILCSAREEVLLGSISLAARLALWAAGAVLLASGLLLMATAIGLFARIGRGTLAPWDPPQKLVVRGVYRYVRNPMITGVMLVLLAEATLLASPALLRWFLLFALINLVYIPLWEERGLTRRFGADYLEYKRHVPRWIPRPHPWTPPSDS